LRIAVFGKYPPIQGGVSANVFEFVESAAQAGHIVHIITNASESGVGVRAVFNNYDDARCLRYPQLVTIHSTSTQANYRYIPYANPYLSKLIGLGLAVFSENDFDAVVGWYFEPYGLAAAIISKLYKKPLFVRTAGSDISKLSYHPDLRHAYGLVVRTAFAILGGPPVSRSNQRLIELGALPESIVPLRPCALPTYYSRAAEKIPIDWRREIASLGLVRDLQTQGLVDLYLTFNEPSRYDSALVTLGIFGKVGEFKGTYDILGLFKRLTEAGHKFNVLWIPSGDAQVLSRFFCELRGIRDDLSNIVVLPPVAPWRIPEFLARCDIACVLEREFPIDTHHPRLPREILASGTALVVSKEIADKQSFCNNLVDGKNCVVVPDPQNIDGAASKIAPLLETERYRKYIGKHGKYLSAVVEKSFDRGNSVVAAIGDLMAERNVIGAT
jgi:glycosyltransferase involved in cell wall biosynthesis